MNTNQNKSGRNRRILVIDDNASIHADFQKILCSSGFIPGDLDKAEAALFGDDAGQKTTRQTFELASALQGQEGLKLVQKSVEEGRRFAMAFVDVRMPPGWDGIETTARLWEADPDLQIVICTAYSDYSWDEMLSRLGTSDRLVILKKPFDSIEVQQLTNALTEKWNLLQESKSKFHDLEEAIGERTRDLQSANDELRTANAQLATATKRANEGIKAKGDFLASMSHEIRTPMNGVIGMLGLLSDSELTSRQREFAQIARSSAEALLSVINDILDFSKIEAGKLTIEPIPFDLRVAVEEVIQIFAATVAEKNLELIVHCAPDMPQQVIGDPGRIRQILTNLVGNAIKFTGNGHVMIKVECESRTGRQARIKFMVEDSGIGIPPDKVGQLFEKFTQADASTTRRYGGTGLGLAISKQLTALMNGDIGVTSTPGEGSTFWFSLPLDIPEGEVKAAPRTGLDGVRVLIVDDNAVNRRVLHEQVTSWRMRNGGYASGVEALKVLREARAAGDPFHIAILDYQMPDMDGEMVARAIKADPELKDTVLVMLSSLGQPDHMNLFREAGIFACLVKPVRQSKLWDVLAEAWASFSAQSNTTPHSVPAVATSAPSTRRKREHAPRVLVVDDSTTNQKVGRLMLENLGCRVDVAASGQEAVCMVEMLPYAVVFMDCEMPDMDGFEATAEIRRRLVGDRRATIVAMTAKAIQGDRELCLEAGMDDYISKPVRIEELDAMLDRWAPSPASTVSASPQMACSPVPPPADDFPALNLVVVERLSSLAMATDPSILAEIYSAFLDSGGEYLKGIRLAIDANDSEALRKSAHALKGAGANVGAEAVAEYSRQLEALGASRGLGNAADIAGRVELEFSRAKTGIQDLSLNRPMPKGAKI